MKKFSGSLSVQDIPITYPSSPSYSANNIPPPPPPLPSPPSLPPPPLPPRRKRESSVGDTSPRTKQATDAPLLPPRETSPPPLPPRRDLGGCSGTLPRMHSASAPRPTNSGWNNITKDVTLPRRNSALDVANLPQTTARRLSQSSLNESSPSSSGHFALSSIPVAHHTSVGVLDSAITLLPPPHSGRSTPQLPPKTHRQTLLMNNHAPR